jgi:RNA polymerase sigma-70 factor (ECF subfamily)
VLNSPGYHDVSDADLLSAVARADDGALRELHDRYAPHLYALARYAYPADAQRYVQDAFVAIAQHAHRHTRTKLDARVWIIVMAQRSMSGHASIR